MSLGRGPMRGRTEPTGPWPPIASDTKRIERARTLWRLSPRQAEVLGLVARGCSNREIALQIGTGEKTVEAHMTQILRRSAQPSRTALIALFWTSL